MSCFLGLNIGTVTYIGHCLALYGVFAFQEDNAETHFHGDMPAIRTAT
jgi:hypothetical protein